MAAGDADNEVIEKARQIYKRYVEGKVSSPALDRFLIDLEKNTNVSAKTYGSIVTALTEARKIREASKEPRRIAVPISTPPPPPPPPTGAQPSRGIREICPECGKSFNTKQEYYAHYRQEHIEKAFGELRKEEEKEHKKTVESYARAQREMEESRERARLGAEGRYQKKEGLLRGLVPLYGPITKGRGEQYTREEREAYQKMPLMKAREKEAEEIYEKDKKLLEELTRKIKEGEELTKKEKEDFEQASKQRARMIEERERKIEHARATTARISGNAFLVGGMLVLGIILLFVSQTLGFFFSGLAFMAGIWALAFEMYFPHHPMTPAAQLAKSALRGASLGLFAVGFYFTGIYSLVILLLIIGYFSLPSGTSAAADSYTKILGGVRSILAVGIGLAILILPLFGGPFEMKIALALFGWAFFITIPAIPDKYMEPVFFLLAMIGLFVGLGVLGFSFFSGFNPLVLVGILGGLSIFFVGSFLGRESLRKESEKLMIEKEKELQLRMALEKQELQAKAEILRLKVKKLKKEAGEE